MRKYRLYHIVATDKQRVIGKENKLPWHFPEDMKHFKATTMGSTIIMGRKTFESLGKKPLPGRTNIVISSSLPPSETEQDLKIVDSVEKALATVKSETAFIIGGESIYQQTMDKIDGIYLTRIPGEHDGDAFYLTIPRQFVEEETKSVEDKGKTLQFVYINNTGTHASS